MSFDAKEVRRVLDAFEESDWTSIYLRVDGCELQLSANGAAGHSGPTGVTTEENLSDNQDVSGALETGTEEPAEAVSVARAPSPTPSVVPDAGLVAITAPSAGIFWRSPQPGAPPFVDVGAEVEADTTTCIVEVMKLMNHVKAGMTGSVVEVLVANGDPVELGQPLFTVSTTAAG